MHLFSQARGSLRYDETLATFVPERSPLAIGAAGGAERPLRPRRRAGRRSRRGHRGRGARRHPRPGAAGAAPHAAAVAAGPLLPLWAVPAAAKSAKRFVDFQNDVTVADIALAAREGYQSVEHLKRYTTLGMGTDQGKTATSSAWRCSPSNSALPIPQVGTTTFRPPYTPVTLGAFPGHEAGAHVEPTRHSRDARVARRARRALRQRGPVEAAALVSAPRRDGVDAANREAKNVRTHVGVVDVSTLGKIELQGRDVAEFLNRVYINRWDTLAVGRCRYGVMLRDDGMVMDDGTTSRLAAAHYLMTTTTVNAAKVMQHLEYLLQADGRSSRCTRRR